MQLICSKCGSQIVKPSVQRKINKEPHRLVTCLQCKHESFVKETILSIIHVRSIPVAAKRKPLKFKQMAFDFS